MNNTNNEILKIEDAEVKEHSIAQQEVKNTEIQEAQAESKDTEILQNFDQILEQNVTKIAFDNHIAYKPFKEYIANVLNLVDKSTFKTSKHLGDYITSLIVTYKTDKERYVIETFRCNGNNILKLYGFKIEILEIKDNIILEFPIAHMSYKDITHKNVKDFILDYLDDDKLTYIIQKVSESKKDFRQFKQQQEEIPQHIKDKANEILTSDDPVRYIFNVHQSLHIGDPDITKTLIAGIGAQCCNNTQGIQVKLDGSSGKGKTDSIKKFVHLNPREYLIEGSLSDKVLFYMMKEMGKAGMIVFSDDVNLSDELTGTIKRATTNYQTKTQHHTLDKDRNAISQEISERTLWLLTSVNNNQSLQLLNRQFGGSVDESAEQDERVFNSQVMDAIFGKLELPITDEVLICREIIRNLKDNLFTVIIPYAHAIEWNDKSNRRNFLMFLDIIKAFAVFRYKQRKIINNNILIATLQDFDDAVDLYADKSEQQKTKLTATELKIINTLAVGKVMTQQQLMKSTGFTQGWISQLVNGNKNIQDSGLISKVKGLTIERRTEIPESGIGTVYRTYYILNGYQPSIYQNTSVFIESTCRAELLTLLDDINRLLVSIINNSKDVINDISNIINKHSDNKYNERLYGFITTYAKDRNLQYFNVLSERLKTQYNINKLTSNIVDKSVNKIQTIQDNCIICGKKLDNEYCIQVSNDVVHSKCHKESTVSMMVADIIKQYPNQRIVSNEMLAKFLAGYCKNIEIITANKVKDILHQRLHEYYKATSNNLITSISDL